jgi:trigger factor
MQTETQVSNAAASSLERRIDMSVPMAEVDKEVEQRLRHMSKTVKMPGFRPGKVPRKMVAQQYGGQARSEAIGAAVEKVFGATVREQNLRVAGYPRIEPKANGNESVFEFTAVFEVYPDIVIGDVSGQAVEKPMLEVTDADVDKTLDVLRQQRTTFVPAGRPSENGDRMVIDFTGRKDGVEFPGGKATDFAVSVGGGAMLPDFDAAITGLGAGATKTFDVAFPADYQATELAGHTVQFDVVVKAVDAPKLPELDAEFAKSLGIKDGDLVKMREEVRANLEREVKKRLQAKIKNQVWTPCWRPRRPGARAVEPRRARWPRGDERTPAARRGGEEHPGGSLVVYRPGHAPRQARPDSGRTGQGQGTACQARAGPLHR